MCFKEVRVYSKFFSDFKLSRSFYFPTQHVDCRKCCQHSSTVTFIVPNAHLVRNTFAAILSVARLVFETRVVHGLGWVHYSKSTKNLKGLFSAFTVRLDKIWLHQAVKFDFMGRSDRYRKPIRRSNKVIMLTNDS